MEKNFLNTNEENKLIRCEAHEMLVEIDNAAEKTCGTGSNGSENVTIKLNRTYQM